MENIRVKGPKTLYDNEEVAPGIRRYIVEHIQSLDAVLADLERAGVTISGAKSQFCMASLQIVRFIFDSAGRYLDTAKVLKIIDWPECQDIREARVFIGVCVYYPIWIQHFSFIASPIYNLFRKNVLFSWNRSHTEVMDLLKIALTSPPAFVSLDYSDLAEDIILAVDASLIS